MTYGSSNRSRRGLLAGLCIVAVGLVLLLDQQGLVSAAYLLRFFWPAVFICFGVEMVISCKARGGRGLVGLLLTAFGVLLLMGSLGFIHVGIYTLWPLLLILWGAWVIGRTLSPESMLRSRIKQNVEAQFADAGSKPNQPWGDKVRNTINETFNSWTGTGTESGEAEFDHVAIFSGIKQRVTVKNFRRGRLLAVCGGFEIDLRRADIDGQTATIEANALMGGGEIRVPENWVVEVRGIPVLGGFTDETHQDVVDSTTAKHLVVKGLAVMGGVVIKN